MTALPPAVRATDAPGPGPVSRLFDRVERWAEGRWNRAVDFFEGRAVDVILRRLEQDVAWYELRVPNNMAHLMEVIRPGDVLLVEGRRRISFAIQKITSSPWSHVTLYVGNGQIIEAEDRGVILSPLMKYAEHNIRLCVPRNARPQDRARVVELSQASLGRSYDVTNVRNLFLSYFASQRQPHVYLGNLEECQEMCSGLIARAYAEVGYPVLPRRHYTQIVPRDFDLSPSFDIVKFNNPGGPAEPAPHPAPGPTEDS